jgi:CDP-diacylglycerol--serine O-phosphatidyltransferase
MNDAEYQQPHRPGDEGGRFRNHRLRRGIHLLPGLLTAANLFCGYQAILVTLKGGLLAYDAAAKFIGLAILFDALDGRVARATGTNSEIGKQFDSLADVVSFGIAPALLAYAWGTRGLHTEVHSSIPELAPFGWLACFAFLLCCAWRLARFNVQGMAPGQEARFFIGMPTPAAAGMVAAIVHARKFPVEDWRLASGWFILMAGLGVLMASSIRYYGFKDAGWRRRQPSLVFIALGLLVAGIYYFSEQVLLVIATAYTVSGFTVQVVRLVRHRLASHPA